MTHSQTLTSAWMAFRDWKHETMLSLCAVLALASMLAPLLVLQGLENGVIGEMRNRLLLDPATLIITPKSDGGNYAPAFIKKLAELPGAAYAIGRTRETATDITLHNGARHVSISLEPAGPGEPVLTKYAMPVPKDGKKPQLVLSAPAATALQAGVGAEVTATLARRAPSGQLESISAQFEVAGILPIAAAERRMAFAPHGFLEDMEDYRDFIAVPRRGLTGQPAAGERKYASFRLYATSLDDVEPLAAKLAEKHIETRTRARDIAAIKALERAIDQIVLIISLAVGAGFAAFMLSSSEGAIRRKRKMLGLLRLFGFNRLALVAYPLTQTVLTAICGFAAALVLYLGVAAAIARAFASQGGIMCVLGMADVINAAGLVFIISIAASGHAALQAASMEPASVIRNV